MWYAIIKWVTVEKKGLLYFTDGHYTGLSKRVFSAYIFWKKVFSLSEFYVFSVCSELSIWCHVYRNFNIYITIISMSATWSSLILFYLYKDIYL